MMDRSSPELIAEEIRQQKYPHSRVLILGGSVIRGEATKFSDLDIVVLFDQVECAYRESFIFKNWPVECFVHDFATLKYFFEEVDAKSGYPCLPSMVAEGIAIPNSTMSSELSAQAKQLARAILAAGPPALSQEELDRKRYAITDLVDDIRDPRSRSELMASGADLLDALADFYFRSQRLWSASGKTIFRRLDQVDAELGLRFEDCFRQLFVQADPTACMALSEQILHKQGGFLFSGYRLDAPSTWRSQG